jgi:NAD(P) transhydrogenase
VPFDFDLIVIGSGPAGEKGAVQAAYFGKRVVIIERQAAPGGAAVHTGTLPSKTLREAALALAGHRQRDLYGLQLSLAPGFAIQQLMARKEAVRHRELERVTWNLARHGVELVRGEARLIGPHTVAVGSGANELRLTGEFILVATGSVPHRPEGVDFSDPAIDDSDELLGIDRLPARMAILGGGVIGCEYACVFAELGVDVTVIEPRERILGFVDEEIVSHLTDAMGSLGVTIRCGTAWTSASRSGGGLAVSLADGSSVATDRIVCSAGRVGATPGLGLEALGVQLTTRGNVAIDRHFATRVPSILAAGDVTGAPALASVSMEQGRVAVCNAFGFTYKQEMADHWPYGIYTIPEISGAGLSTAEAASRGGSILVGRAAYRLNARSDISGATSGLMKLLFERQSRRLAGAHIIGEQAIELIHTAQAIMALGGTVEHIIDMVFNYPSLGELYKYAAYDALGQW